MSDQSSPFAPFQTDPAPVAPQSQPPADQNSSTPRRGRRKKNAAAPKTRAKRGSRRTAVAAAPAAEQAPTAASVTRQRKARTPRPMTFSVEVLPLLAGLTTDEVSFVASVLRGMQEVPKKGRARIAAALAKLCA